MIESVERAPEREHDVVGHVDDVRDRSDAGCEEAGAQPRRRGGDPHIAKEPADVAGAAFEILDDDVGGLVACERWIDPRRRREREPVEDRDLARETVDGEQVRTVAGHLELEHGVGDRQDVRERRPRFPRLPQDEDAGMVGAELELTLGENHPVRDRPAELGPLERASVRKERPRERDRDRRARTEVPRAADDLTRLCLADVDPAQLEAVGIRVLARLDDPADAIEPEVAVRVRDAATDDAVDLGGGHREPVRDVLDRRRERDVVAQPRDRHLHENCLRSRRSFSQSCRMSGSPWRSIAIRSRPRPNAKPETSSGP